MSEREFVVINEEAARTAQNMMSFNEYQLGSRTKEYQEDVNEVYDLAEEVVARRGEEYRERAWRLATRYAKNLGKYFNEEARRKRNRSKPGIKTMSSTITASRSEEN